MLSFTPLNVILLPTFSYFDSLKRSLLCFLLKCAIEYNESWAIKKALKDKLGPVEFEVWGNEI